MKKKIIYILLLLIIVSSIILGVLWINKKNETNKVSLSLNEQQWIEQSKNNVIDIYVPSDVDVFSYIGKGVFFDYLTYFSEETGLTINPIPYKLNEKTESKMEYSFKLVDTMKKNQILVYEDEYIIISKNENIYNDISELTDLNIAVLTHDYEYLKEKLTDLKISETTYDSNDDLFNELIKEESELDSVIVLKSQCLNYLFENELHINYHFKSLTKKYVLELSGDKVLNSILEKQYTNWHNEFFETSYNNHLLSEYFNYNSITELEKNSLLEKKYIYGFVSNGAYDLVKDDKLTGINYNIIKSFAKFANIDMDYNDEYLSYNDLINDFNKDKVDIFFTAGKQNYNGEHFETIRTIKTNVVVLMNVNNPVYIIDEDDLKNYTISVVKNSYIDKYLAKLGIETKRFNNMDKLLNSLNKDSMVALDLENYEYYKGSNLINFKIAYQFDLNENYGYVINENDKIFYDLFNFYLEYFNIEDVIVESYSDIYVVPKKSNILFILVIILSLVLCLEFINHLKKLIQYLKKRTKHTLSKNDKLKYIDQLTSLKNRLYLNDTIEKWDNSAIYPQSIIIVDLNDLSEINDNFGHEEGDKVILEAANILIRTQLPNTEIIRTDGSEFLIYMIEYDEKQTVAYLRKLNKELRDLSHGYGAVTGYSIINDGIKTIDDAINEATLDMKTNKELLEEE